MFDEISESFNLDVIEECALFDCIDFSRLCSRGNNFFWVDDDTIVENLHTEFCSMNKSTFFRTYQDKKWMYKHDAENFLFIQRGWSDLCARIL